MDYRIIRYIIDSDTGYKFGRGIIINGTQYRIADGRIPISDNIVDYLQDFWDNGIDINYSAARREVIYAHWPEHMQLEAHLENVMGYPNKLITLIDFAIQLKLDIPKP